MSETLVMRGPILTGTRRLDDARLVISGGRIRSVARVRRTTRRVAADEPEAYRIPAGRVLAPGFVDIHVHGAAGVEATEGADAIRAMARFLAGRGISAFLPTSASARLSDLAQFAATVASVRRDQERAARSREPLAEARVLGANLEGPALDPGHRGAHDPARIVEPGAMLAAWREAPARWREVRIMTLAPERPGGIELTRHLALANVVVSIGHTNATFAQAMEAYAAGAASTTHLFNAMTGFAHREPGVAAAALSHATAAVELIADGIHVDRALWPLLWRILGRRLVLISDAMSAAGAADGDYRLGGLQVSVRDRRATLADGTIAGSTITVADAVANLVAAGVPLGGAVAAATATPARVIRRRTVGRVATGARADLVELDAAGHVHRVMLTGRWLKV